MGKVLLAGLETGRQREVLEQVQFTQRGPNALTDLDELLAELERVRVAGLAVNNEELAYGLRSIAAPVRSQNGEVVAAINLAVHRTMVSLDSLVAHLGPQLKQTAAEISARIGYSRAGG
jgi:IclR family pca regulon transcriptional regulator